jgi:hypothetical protein
MASIQLIDIEKLAKNIAKKIGENYIAFADKSSNSSAYIIRDRIKDGNMLKLENKAYERIVSIFNLDNKTVRVYMPNILMKEHETTLDDALKEIGLFFDHTDDTYREELCRVYQIPELIFTPVEYKALLKTSEQLNNGILKS